MKLLLVAFGTVLATVGAVLVGTFTGTGVAVFAGFCGGPAAFVFLGWALHAARPHVTFGEPPQPAQMMAVQPRNRSRLAARANGQETA